mmetsp:Transcript_10497/g.64292  ORF Transcript_10497/g.64292 Transcript_10497/m.64292 type:complete len:297 (+) Transcript_10497:8866-9756(+)
MVIWIEDTKEKAHLLGAIVLCQVRASFVDGDEKVLGFFPHIFSCKVVCLVQRIPSAQPSKSLNGLQDPPSAGLLAVLSLHKCPFVLAATHRRWVGIHRIDHNLDDRSVPQFREVIDSIVSWLHGGVLCGLNHFQFFRPVLWMQQVQLHLVVGALVLSELVRATCADHSMSVRCDWDARIRILLRRQIFVPSSLSCFCLPHASVVVLPPIYHSNCTFHQARCRSHPLHPSLHVSDDVFRRFIAVWSPTVRLGRFQVRRSWFPGRCIGSWCVEVPIRPPSSSLSRRKVRKQRATCAWT